MVFCFVLLSVLSSLFAVSGTTIGAIDVAFNVISGSIVNTFRPPVYHMDVGATCALRQITVSAPMCRYQSRINLPANGSRSFRNSNFVSRLLHRHVICAPIIVPRVQNASSSVQRRRLKDFVLAQMLGLQVSHREYDRSCKLLTGIMAHDQRKHDVFELLRLAGNARLRILEHALAAARDGRKVLNVGSVQAPQLVKLVFERLSRFKTRSGGSARGSAARLLQLRSTHGCSSSPQVVNSSGSNCVKSLLSPLSEQPFIQTATAVAPSQQVAVVGYGGVRDAIVVDLLKGSDTAFQAVAVGLAGESKRWLEVGPQGQQSQSSVGNRSGTAPQARSALLRKGTAEGLDPTRSILECLSQWQDLRTAPGSGQVTDLCKGLGFELSSNASPAADDDLGALRFENVTRMLNSKSNTDNAKHAMLPGILAAMGAHRVIYAVADPALAIHSLLRRTVGVIVPAARYESTRALLYTFLEVQLFGANLGILPQAVLGGLDGMARAKFGGGASTAVERLDRLVAVLDSVNHWDRKRGELKSGRYEQPFATDFFGVARHMASWVGRRHSFDSLWLNLDSVQDWRVRVAAYAFAGVDHRLYPFPAYKSRSSERGDPLDAVIRGSRGMADALQIESSLPPVVELPWKWSRMATVASLDKQEAPGHGDKGLLYRHAGNAGHGAHAGNASLGWKSSQAAPLEHEIEAKVPIGWYDAPWLTDPVQAMMRNNSRQLRCIGEKALQSCLSLSGTSHDAELAQGSLIDWALSQRARQSCLKQTIGHVKVNVLSQTCKGAGAAGSNVAGPNPLKRGQTTTALQLLSAATLLAAVPAEALVIAEVARRLDEQLCKQNAENVSPSAGNGSFGRDSGPTWRPDTGSWASTVPVHLEGSSDVTNYELPRATRPVHNDSDGPSSAWRFLLRAAMVGAAEQVGLVPVGHGVGAASLDHRGDQNTERSRPEETLPTGTLCKGALHVAATRTGNLPLDPNLPSQIALLSGLTGPVRVNGSGIDSLNVMLDTQYHSGFGEDSMDFAGERWGPGSVAQRAAATDASLPFDASLLRGRDGVHGSCEGIQIEDAAAWADWSG